MIHNYNVLLCLCWANSLVSPRHREMINSGKTPWLPTLWTQRYGISASTNQSMSLVSWDRVNATVYMIRAEERPVKEVEVYLAITSDLQNTTHLIQSIREKITPNITSDLQHTTHMNINSVCRITIKQREELQKYVLSTGWADMTWVYKYMHNAYIGYRIEQKFVM